MNYHNITHDDMLNGDGLRVVLFVSGCDHNCKGCQNPQTHPIDSGILFDDAAKSEIFNELSKPYISGITFSGGDPLHSSNIHTIRELVEEINDKFPEKTIWLYTGLTADECRENSSADMNYILHNIDVLVEGRFIEELSDINTPWVGSTNQSVIYLKNRKI